MYNQKILLLQSHHTALRISLENKISFKTLRQVETKLVLLQQIFQNLSFAGLSAMATCMETVTLFCL